MNARLGRFVKSYLRFLPWSDSRVYMQAQAYWVFANWQAASLFGDSRFEEVAVACTEAIRGSQQPDGYWTYPNPEWSGRIATVEGCMAGLAMLATYVNTGDEELLEGATQWYEYLTGVIGFSEHGGEPKAVVNYFAGWDRAVPNNNTLALWFMASLARASGSEEFLEHVGPMVRWLSEVQLETGELPYLLGTQGEPDRNHFLCYQYNYFELVDLLRYYELTGHELAREVAFRMAGYLASGVTLDGWAMYDCSNSAIQVPYYTSALGMALREATSTGLGDYGLLADNCYSTVVHHESLPERNQYYSKGNYRVMVDRRSYPRYRAMILHHLLSEAMRDVPE